ncbi:MAG: alpha/beta hydrolase [Dehalococcoidia bacterium]
MVVCAALASAPRAAAADGEPIAWRACGGGFDCARFAVPLDYDDRGGKSIELALIRLPATDQDARIGSLFANPGGPGASGVEFVRAWARGLADEVRAKFDIVGWDPRGIGESSPVSCNDNLKALISIDLAPDSEAEFDAFAREQRSLNELCAARHGDILPHLGTNDVARDLDRMRQAVGDPGLTYVGYSYGTEIGQAYAALFPGNVRAMVLDGAVDLAQDPDTRTLVQAAGFERALANFLADCAERSCIEGYADPAEGVRELLRRADAGPIPARTADRPAREGEAFYGLITPLYQRLAWGILGRAISEALEGDASRLVQLTDTYFDRQRDGRYSNQFEANLAVNCVDQAATKLPTTWPAYQESAARFALTAPTFGAYVANGLFCDRWGAKPDPLGPASGYSGPPLVVVSTTGDPATPYEWGAAVAEQLGASLITFGGEGHTAYGRDDCVDGLVNAYLLRLETPGTARCGSDAPVPESVEARPPATSPALDPGGRSPAAALVVALALALVAAFAGVAFWAKWRRDGRI